MSPNAAKPQPKVEKEICREAEYRSSFVSHKKAQKSRSLGRSLRRAHGRVGDPVDAGGNLCALLWQTSGFPDSSLAKEAPTQPSREIVAVLRGF